MAARANRGAKRTATRRSGVLKAIRSLSGGAETGVDKLIHERVRLAIVSALAVNTSLSFTELKDILLTTDGNLSVHARKLEEASYIHCRKFFEGRSPKTEYRITAAGRKALDRYLRHMEHLVKAVHGGKD
jgi:DNA-binding transcriptional ArsR family regulator